ncbi:MAG: hypothetical protein PWQ46_219 [Methanomicrobiaceae archaeon]|nr:hypothetical protein [Methanomicrobiaceae archaeon]
MHIYTPMAIMVRRGTCSFRRGCVVYAKPSNRYLPPWVDKPPGTDSGGVRGRESPAPLPQGGDSSSIHWPGVHQPSCLRLIRVKILFFTPGTAIGPIAPHCPPPQEGAGGGRGAAGRRGCFHEYRSTRDAGDRGGGSRLRLPPPRQPLPPGAILHRYSSRECTNHRVSG